MVATGQLNEARKHVSFRQRGEARETKKARLTML